MNSRKLDPAFAIWLLRRLTPQKNQDVLIGDLLEHLSNRRSALWFWREVLTLIAFGFADGVRKHWLDLVFALGGTALYSSSLKAIWRTPAFEYLFGYSIGWPWLISAACQFTLLATIGSVEIGIILIFVRLLK